MSFIHASVSVSLAGKTLIQEYADNLMYERRRRREHRFARVQKGVWSRPIPWEAII